MPFFSCCCCCIHCNRHYCRLFPWCTILLTQFKENVYYSVWWKKKNMYHTTHKYRVILNAYNRVVHIICTYFSYVPIHHIIIVLQWKMKISFKRKAKTMMQLWNYYQRDVYKKFSILWKVISYIDIYNFIYFFLQ